MSHRFVFVAKCVFVRIAHIWVDIKTKQVFFFFFPSSLTLSLNSTEFLMKSPIALSIGNQLASISVLHSHFIASFLSHIGEKTTTMSALIVFIHSGFKEKV